jgi:hypothetical protein
MKAVNSIMVLVAVTSLAVGDTYELYGNEHLVITPETVMVEPGGAIFLFDNSTAEITSTLDVAWTIGGNDESHLVFNNGRIVNFRLYDSSTCLVTGGIGGFLCTNFSSHLTITGGYFVNLCAMESSRITIEGGTIVRMAGTKTSVITLYGTNFQVDNDDDQDGFMAIESDPMSIVAHRYNGIDGYRVVGSGGYLKGTSKNGDDWNIHIPQQESFIFLVPEPISVLLLGMGGAILAIKQRPRWDSNPQ